jgi:hypothetical protein
MVANNEARVHLLLRRPWRRAFGHFSGRAHSTPRPHSRCGGCEGSACSLSPTSAGTPSAAPIFLGLATHRRRFWVLDLQPTIGGPERASYSISNKWPPPHTEAPTPVRGAGRAVNVAPPPNGGGRRYRIFFDNAWFQRTDVWGHRVTFLSNTSASRALDAVATSNLHCLVNGPEPVRKSTGDPNRPLRAFCACPAFAELDERWIPKSATDIAG